MGIPNTFFIFRFLPPRTWTSRGPFAYAFCHCLRYTSTHFRHWSGESCNQSPCSSCAEHSGPQTGLQFRPRGFSPFYFFIFIEFCFPMPHTYIQPALSQQLTRFRSRSSGITRSCPAGVCCIMPGHTFWNSIPA